ncbi:TetR family transcriptional regulator [Paenibacillus lautus]|uniref:TetR/AcrR family transcriptional regulator n=1 Tax=Paenibacillus lautus TaxID=1401 RepID=UPI001B188FD1|nr:TetR/AcrR family transcriptional regulator [Paenibacillus lautus]GIO95025.1 TetR family transcriptional regulator [Paenibacillus lautus]
MRERILNETIRLIQRQGFTFTVSDLARGLAISKRTIYEHFSSKEEIVEHIIDGMILHIQQREHEIAGDEELTVLEKIHQILICLPQEMEKMDLGMLPDLKRSHYAQWEKLDTFFREEWGIVTELMEQGMAEGSIKRIHMPLFIDLYLGSLHQIYDSRATVKHQLPLGELLQSVMDILLFGIAAEKREES